MKNKEIRLLVREYESLQELEASDRDLLKSAREALPSSYAPYSGFHVGAALLLQNGVTVTGTNQENAAYPSGLCAERVAVFSAASQHPGMPVLAIAITARAGNSGPAVLVSPCGACRQVIAEYEHLYGINIRIILGGDQGKVMVIDNAAALLPFAFSGKDLEAAKK